MRVVARLLINIPLLMLLEWRRKKRQRRARSCSFSLKSCEADDCIELVCDLGKIFD